MTSKSLNTQVLAYKKALESGEIQETYQSLVSIIQSLRVEFSKKYKEEFSVASILHGYIDFTYFYLQNDYLKSNKLKLAIVLNHQQANFELWLLGQTKDVQVSYWKKLKDVRWVNECSMPEYSIFEIPLLEHPDFDNLNQLSASVHKAFESLLREIFAVLKSYEK
ncbi:DUF7000 family protein [Vibrio vulnificus]|uniref:DUF7000 family protein n=1 Tax=Vibrio vulnificus TaxID=672 RepID=UPI0005F1AA54|nr:hypothetical protein [Vibrio vulnificus]EJP4178165.1 hypothetical protein [Vibrio vulnificus]